MTRKRLPVIVLLILLAVSGWFYYRHADSPVFTVSQLAGTSARPFAGGADIQLSGVVMYGTVENDSGPTRFVMTDCRNDIPVEFQGRLPASFREGRNIVVTGMLDAENIFHARALRSRKGENCDPAEVIPAPQMNKKY